MVPTPRTLESCLIDRASRTPTSPQALQPRLPLGGNAERLSAEGSLDLTPCDLTTFKACAHASRLDIDKDVGRPVPDRGRDPDADLLAELGRRHEQAYVDHLRAQGLEVETIGAHQCPDEERARLIELMRARVDVIAQAPLRDGASQRRTPDAEALNPVAWQRD